MEVRRRVEGRTDDINIYRWKPFAIATLSGPLTKKNNNNITILYSKIKTVSYNIIITEFAGHDMSALRRRQQERGEGRRLRRGGTTEESPRHPFPGSPSASCPRTLESVLTSSLVSPVRGSDERS